MQPGTPSQFADPAAPGLLRPRIRDLDGRLVIIVPLNLQVVPNALSQIPGATQERITADVFVLDGQPLAYGGRPEDPDTPSPHTLSITVPAKFEGMYLSQVGIVGALRAAVGKSVVLGRISRGTSGDPNRRAPWQLIKLAPEDPARAMAAQFYGAQAVGTWTPPVPTKIEGAPPPSMAASGTYATTMPHTAAGVAIPQGGIALPPSSPAWQPPVAPPPAPPGFEAVWPSLTPEQRQGILAGLAGPTSAQAPAPANPF